MSEMRDFLAPHDTPMSVQVVDGEVVALGPDGLAVALTPDAARVSGQRLIKAAGRAEGEAQVPEDST